MRRRQINQMRAAGLLPPVSAYLRPAWEAAQATVDAPEILPAPVDPGCCKKCGRHIGRGVRFHERACNGTVVSS